MPSLIPTLVPTENDLDADLIDLLPGDRDNIIRVIIELDGSS